MTKETQPLSQVLAAASELLPTPPTASTSPPKSISPRTQPSFDFAEPATFRKQPSERLPLTQAEADAWTAHLEHIKYNLHFQRWYRWQNDQPKTPRSFTATEIRAWFEAEALRRLGEPFVVDEYNARIVELLCLYFAEDPRFEQVTDGAGRPYSLKKGLLLRGGVGTGKTTLLPVVLALAQARRVHAPARALLGLEAAVMQLVLRVGVAVFAAGAHLGTALPGVEGVRSPFDFRVFHRKGFISGC